MLIVKQDKTRKEEEGQIFVELTIYRDVRNIADCNRLGYWCDKAHLSHFIMECAKCFTQDELKNILKMNGNNIYIEKNNLLDAYKNGNADNKKMLENLFGKEMFRPKNIMERIKTFDDAFKELGENHPLVKEYHKRHLFLEDDSDISSDLVAYLKLRIITAALNEGWTPQFTKDEYRYYPWFWLYTKEEIAKMNKEERKKVVLFGGNAITARMPVLRMRIRLARPRIRMRLSGLAFASNRLRWRNTPGNNSLKSTLLSWGNR